MKEYYHNNNGYLYIYKSSRKNSQFEYVSLLSLITKNEKLTDERILDYFISKLDTITYYFIKYNHIEISGCIAQQKCYYNYNQKEYFYGHVNYYRFSRDKYSTIESFIKELYNMFCLLYPHWSISINEIFSNKSISYFISEWYNNYNKKFFITV